MDVIGAPPLALPLSLPLPLPLFPLTWSLSFLKPSHLASKGPPVSKATNGGRTFSWGDGLIRAAPGHYMLCAIGE